MQLEFEAGNDKKYKVDGIWDSVVYTKESTTDQLPGLYYLVSWKGYPKEENTLEPVLAIQHYQKLVTAYHKDNPEKPIAISLPVDMAPPMARPIRAPTKQGWPAGPMTAPIKKRGRLVSSTTTTIKRAKKS